MKPRQPLEYSHVKKNSRCRYESVLVYLQNYLLSFDWLCIWRSSLQQLINISMIRMLLDLSTHIRYCWCISFQSSDQNSSFLSYKRIIKFRMYIFLIIHLFDAFLRFLHGGSCHSVAWKRKRCPMSAHNNKWCNKDNFQRLGNIVFSMR